MIEEITVTEGRAGLAIYRVEVEAPNIATGVSQFDPLALLLERYPTPTGRHVLERFPGMGSSIGPSSFRVACHVVSFPDVMLVIDTTFHTTSREIFPELLECITRDERRRPAARPIWVLYTHAHVDHAGGRNAVEGMGDAVRIFTHPYTAELFPLMSGREAFFRTGDSFLRDCGISKPCDEIREEVRDLYRGMIEAAGTREEDHPFSTRSEGPLHVDEFVDPQNATTTLDEERIQILRFDGHIPGHLCVLIDREHLITGDMWLPATTSTVTPGTIARRAGVPADRCGVDRYVESCERLLAKDVDRCFSYPSHEHVFRNPKRMAMRDLELLQERSALVYEVLREHRRKPMRVLDLAWGGTRGLPIWKLGGVKYGPLLAHDEAAAYVQDLLAFGDLREVEPERYLWNETSEFSWALEATLKWERHRYA